MWKGQGRWIERVGKALTTMNISILSFYDQISALSNSCCHHIRVLRCIRPYVVLHTSKTIASYIAQNSLSELFIHLSATFI